MRFPLRFALASGLLLLSILASLPVAEAQTSVNLIENFDDDSVPANPASQDTPSRYTYSASNQNAFTSTAQKVSNPNGFRFQSIATGGYSNFGLAYDACTDFSGIDWKVYMASLPASSNTESFELSVTEGQTASTNRILLQISSAGAVVINMADQVSTTVPGVTMPTSTWVDFHIDGIDCTSNKATFSSDALGFLTTLDAPGDNIAGVMNDFSITHFGSTTNTVFMDDIFVNGAFEIAEPGFIFCSGSSRFQFGYEFVEDVQNSDQSDETDVAPAAQIGIDDPLYFLAEGGNGFALLGKEMAVESAALNVTFKIEAAVDNADSNFRVTFGFVNGITRGDGDSTGSFDTSLFVNFNENGNNWGISIGKVVAGVTTELAGGGIQQGDPNDATEYQFIYDSRPGYHYVALRDVNGNDLLNKSGANWPTSFNSLTSESQWFVASGSGTSLFSHTVTALQAAGGSRHSTCIWDLTGLGSVAGDQGVRPVQGEEGGGGGGGLGGLGGSPGFPGLDLPGLAAASGMSEAAFSGFAAVLFMLILAGTMGGFGAAITGGKSGAVMVFGGIGAVGGLGLDMFFGLIPLWFAALLGILVIGVIVWVRR